ncbi:hypothetical protein CAPTEDRAFT_99687 [Capitella teleta]|uniref:Uncharacterized protein n=1 Tax=Capitella teleta TaxID=283909 RepID=R7TMB3_CAPTE|nr:hypothetical protein CAPTEDRAFT_99687 [Capitella teleta]|eukprot:ELT94774.1 hypothetical protein CAPTEDRAFT_99687 [Capitella teleta]
MRLRPSYGTNLYNLIDWRGGNARQSECRHRLKDLATLSPHFQTYDLEAFHSLLNQFALN